MNNVIALPSRSKPGQMLSPYQSEIVRFVRDLKGSCCVIAVAGSGKTFTIEECLYEIPETNHVQCFAFNVTIAKELNVRIDRLRQTTGKAYRNLRASTFHSVGSYAVRRHLEGRGVKMQDPNGSKVGQIAREWLGEQRHQKTGEPLSHMYADFASKLVGLAKGAGVGCLVPDVEDVWYEMIRHHDLYLDNTEATEEEGVFIARKLLQKSNDAALTGVIDFDDMLYLPLLWRLRLWQNDFVIVDEAQDTNPVRRAIAKLCLKLGGRLIAVGDPCQAIYGFTGASHDAIDIIKREFNAIELPLTVSYRCAKAVVAHAQNFVSHIESHPDAKEGQFSALKLRDAVKVLTPEDAILCRQTAPLIKLAFTFIARGKPVVVLGREIGTGLVTIIKRMKADTLAALDPKLEAFRQREVAKFTAKGEEGKAEAVNDRIDCIYTFINNLDEDQQSVAALINSITALFSDQNGAGRLTLATIHKAKGKEWPTVAILMPELMPSKWARQQWQADQERNIQYVGDTRAMDHLIYLTDDNLGEKEAA